MTSANGNSADPPIEPGFLRGSLRAVSGALTRRSSASVHERVRFTLTKNRLPGQLAFHHSEMGSTVGQGTRWRLHGQVTTGAFLGYLFAASKRSDEHPEMRLAKQKFVKVPSCR